MINVLNQQISITVPGNAYVMCYVRTYCQILCSVCNISHKCEDIDCVETPTLQARVFTYARRCAKDPGWSWSRDSFRKPLLYGVGKVSNYMLPHTSDTFQMQGARFNCYQRQYNKLFDLKLSIFVCFVCFISFILVSV